MNKTFIAIAAAGMLAISAAGQEPFQNLNFESAQNLPQGVGGEVLVTNAVPGWMVFSGSNQLSGILYNDGYHFNVPLPPAQLLGPNASEPGPSIGGDFSVYLADGDSIAQTGLIPTGTESLTFEVSPPGLFQMAQNGGSWPPHAPFLVTLGGQSMACMTIFNGPDYSLDGIDVSSLAGQTETLSFISYDSIEVDNIQFSTQPIPEPGVSLIFAFGGVLIFVSSQARLKGRLFRRNL